MTVTRLRLHMLTIQVALMVFCTYGAALAARSFGVVSELDLGVRLENVLGVSIPTSGVQGAARRDVFNLIRDRVRTLGGVEGVAAGAMPLASGCLLVSVSVTEPLTAGELEAQPRNGCDRRVDAAYFEVVGTRIVAGRVFDHALDASGQVVVLSRVLALSLARPEQLIGESVWINGRAARVVGIAEDVWGRGPEADPDPLAYALDPDSPLVSSLLVRTSSRPDQTAQAVRRTIESVLLSPGPVRFLLGNQLVADALKPQRAQAVVLSAIGLFTLVFGAVSILSATQAVVRLRAREGAVRVALGARPGQAVRNICTGLGSRVAIGLAVGLFASFAASRAAASLWFGIDPVDGVAVAVVVGLAAIASLVAVWRTTADMTRLRLVDLLRQE
jgi:hypothetical protein